jgi:hypothetical protein
VQSLADYLGGCGQTDREKARAIFSWVADNVVYDGSRLGERPDAGAVLKGRRAVCAGYAALFEALAEAAGLEAVIIYGEARGRGPEAARTPDGLFNHDWNAVKIEDEWGLVDCAWGAGRLDEGGRFTARFDGHYFLAPPEQFAYDHLPNDPKWQLLDRPRSRQDFLRQVEVHPAFFDCGLRLASHREGYVEVHGRVSITIDAPQDVNLMASLHRNGVELKEGHTFAQRGPTGYQIQAVFPKTGDYILRVHARRSGASVACGSEDQQYDCALEYRVHATESDASTFPKMYLSFQEERCVLEEPLSAVLRAGRPVGFRLVAPEAEEALVFCNGSAERLASEGGGVFSGTVTLEAGDAIVFARYPGANKHVALLGYVVKP